MLRCGIEYEFPLADQQHRFVDFSNTSFEQLDEIVAKLPKYEADYPELRIGDLGIKEKRWYIEGYERFDKQGTYLKTEIKGMEIRTPICSSIDEAVATLETDYTQFVKLAMESGFRPLATSYNPFQPPFAPQPPLNTWETTHRTTPEEQTATIHMLTYGPDVSFSYEDWDAQRVIRAATKLTYYSPYLVPFSFSSPFNQGKLWGGLSRRTHERNGLRPAALAFLGNKADLIDSRPTLTEIARVPAEAGRIEFKGFDCCADLKLYGSLLALVIGVALSDELTDTLAIPPAAQLQAASIQGLRDDTIYRQTRHVLELAGRALPAADQGWLAPLEGQLRRRRCPADQIIERYEQHGDVMRALEEAYADRL